jgi:hypothetical protein
VQFCHSCSRGSCKLPDGTVGGEEGSTNWLRRLDGGFERGVHPQGDLFNIGCTSAKGRRSSPGSDRDEAGSIDSGAKDVTA